MSSKITSPAGKKSSSDVKPPSSKGKTKAEAHTAVEDDDDDDDDEEMEDNGDDEEEEDDDDDEDHLDEIDPSVIVSRRTRGVRVDYTSQEALEKAGLKPDEDEDEDDDADKDVVMRD